MVVCKNCGGGLHQNMAREPIWVHDKDDCYSCDSYLDTHAEPADEPKATLCRHCRVQIHKDNSGQWIHDTGRPILCGTYSKAEPEGDEPKVTLCKHCGEEIAPRHYTHVAGDEPRCSEHGPFAAPADKPTAALTQADVWVQMARDIKRIADALEKGT